MFIHPHLAGQIARHQRELLAAAAFCARPPGCPQN